MANYSHLLGQLVIARAVVLSQASLYSICSAGVFQMQPFGLLIGCVTIHVAPIGRS